MHHVLQRPVGCEPVDEAVVRDRRHDEPRDLRQRLVDVERRRQRATGVGEHPQPLLGAALLREVVEDVDRHPHIAAVIEHGRGADDRPAPLAAVPEAVLQLPLRLAALHERDPARQLCERQRIAVLVEDLEPSDDLLAGRGEELRERVEAAERRRGLVRVDDPAVRGLRGDAVGDTAKDRLELRTGLADAILGAPAMRCGGDVARHRLGDADVRRRERAGTVAVQHEAPERAAGLDERDERHRTDALGAECVVQLGDLVVLEHVVHDEHGRIGGAALPREPPADGQPVVLREAAPRPELDSAVIAEQHDRGAVDLDRALEGVERVLEDLVERARTSDRVGESVDRVELVRPVRELVHEPRVLERGGGQPCQLDERGLVLVRESPALPGEPDRAEVVAVPADERRGEHVAGSQRAVLTADRRREVVRRLVAREEGSGLTGADRLPRKGEDDREELVGLGRRVGEQRGRTRPAQLLAPPPVHLVCGFLLALVDRHVVPRLRVALIVQPPGYTVAPAGR